MAKCWMCGNEFDVAATRMEFFDAVNGEFDYDELFDGQCSDCTPNDPGQIAGDIALGQALEMYTGDREWDPDKAL